MNRKSSGSTRKEQGVSLEDDVKKIVSEKLSVSIDEVKIDSNFIDDLKADSLDIVELGMAFEDKFGVSIPDEDYEKLRTVNDAVQYIETRK
jgi:acyl carrier protein